MAGASWAIMGAISPVCRDDPNGSTRASYASRFFSAHVRGSSGRTSVAGPHRKRRDIAESGLGEPGQVAVFVGGPRVDGLTFPGQVPCNLGGQLPVDGTGLIEQLEKTGEQGRHSLLEQTQRDGQHGFTICAKDTDFGQLIGSHSSESGQQALDRGDLVAANRHDHVVYLTTRLFVCRTRRDVLNDHPNRICGGAVLSPLGASVDPQQAMANLSVHDEIVGDTDNGGRQRDGGAGQGRRRLRRARGDHR